MSRTHANRGAVAESAIEAVHRGYTACGHYVQRNPTAWRIIGKTKAGQMLAVPGSESPPDWIVVAEGVAFLLDVKSTIGPRWSLADLPEHQAAAFDRWQGQGPTFRAGVVLSLNHHGALAWLPWSWLGPRWWSWYAQSQRAAPGTASISVGEIGAHRLRSWDWLPRALAGLGVDG